MLQFYLIAIYYYSLPKIYTYYSKFIPKPSSNAIIPILFFKILVCQSTVIIVADKFV